MHSYDLESRTRRLREDVHELERLLSNANAPLDALDRPALEAICSYFGGDSSDVWHRDALERLLVVRDGVYDAREYLANINDKSEFSVSQILGAIDRVHADLSSVLRLIPIATIAEAQNTLDGLNQGPAASSASVVGISANLRREADEVITSAFYNSRQTTLNIFASMPDEGLRNARLDIQRLSASAFAIKCDLQQKVIFEAKFKFITDGADQVLSRLRDFIGKIKGSYTTQAEMAVDLECLAERGGRFVKTLKTVIDTAFRPQDESEEVKFSINQAYQSASVQTSCVSSGGSLVVAGHTGVMRTLDVSAGKVALERRLDGVDHIFCVRPFRSGRLAVGTNEGLILVNELGNLDPLRAPYRERVVAVGVLPRAIITGSGDGHLRLWSLGTNEGVFRQDFSRKIGRSIQKVIDIDGQIYAIAADKLIRIGAELSIEEEFPLYFRANDIIATFSKKTIVAVGPGVISLLNLDDGVFIRSISTDNSRVYTAVGMLSDRYMVVGTSAGNLLAYDIHAGLEVGSINIDMGVKGLRVADGRVFAYGGGSNRGRSVLRLAWDRRSLKLEPLLNI